MAKKKKIFCFTHYDLDGAVSALVVKWAHPGYEIDCKPLVGFEARQELTQWLLNNNFSDFEKVFFLDIDVSALKDLIDYPNVMIIDHHKSHVDNKAYEKAVPIIKEYPSACLLAYRVFKKIYDSKFTDAQKTLVVYGNDFDSYTKDLPESYILNVIFWNTQKSFDSFMETYADGFKPFTSEQQAIFKIYTNELTKILAGLTVYQGMHADVDGEYRIVVATFAEKCSPNDVSDYLLKEYEADVAIVANLKTKHISFRRPKDGTMKLDVFAKDIADGGGHEYSAGGTLTGSFLEFAKTLKPV